MQYIWVFSVYKIGSTLTLYLSILGHLVIALSKKSHLNKNPTNVLILKYLKIFSCWWILISGQVSITISLTVG